MKKLILSIAIMVVFLAFPTAAHAVEMLEKDYIKSEIWAEIWLGKSDDGTEFLNLRTSIIFLKNGLTKITAMMITTGRLSAN